MGGGGAAGPQVGKQWRVPRAGSATEVGWLSIPGCRFTTGSSQRVMSQRFPVELTQPALVQRSILRAVPPQPLKVPRSPPQDSAAAVLLFLTAVRLNPGILLKEAER